MRQKYRNALTGFSKRVCELRFLTLAVNGGFSSWSHWSHCSQKCGQGMKHRRRYCNNPKPANGGQTCKGSHKQAKPCYGRRCQGTDQWDCTLYMKNLHEITRGEKCFFSSPPTWQPSHAQTSNWCCRIKSYTNSWHVRLLPCLSVFTFRIFKWKLLSSNQGLISLQNLCTALAFSRIDFFCTLNSFISLISASLPHTKTMPHNHIS